MNEECVEGRHPTKSELGIIERIFEGYRPDYCMVWDNYISDGPGYAGWVAVTLGGEPNMVASFTKDKHGNIVLNKELI